MQQGERVLGSNGAKCGAPHFAPLLLRPLWSERSNKDHLRCLLTESGEMLRWEEARRETPETLRSSIPLISILMLSGV